jgi:hypothetical protein
VVFFKYGWHVSRRFSLKTENGRHCSKTRNESNTIRHAVQQTSHTWKLQAISTPTAFPALHASGVSSSGPYCAFRQLSKDCPGSHFAILIICEDTRDGDKRVDNAIITFYVPNAKQKRKATFVVAAHRYGISFVGLVLILHDARTSIETRCKTNSVANTLYATIQVGEADRSIRSVEVNLR